MVSTNMSQYSSTKKDKGPYHELCKFANEYGFFIEIEKPFKEMDNLFLKVTNKDGEILAKLSMDNIFGLNSSSATLLNELSKNAK